MGFAELLKSYIEIGLLGVCGIVIVLMAWKSFSQKNKDRDDCNNELKERNNIIDEKFNAMFDLLEKQNSEYQEQQSKNTELLINSIIQGVTSHVPSAEENKRLTTISNQIDDVLQEMLVETCASRTSLFQYHNGGKGINKQSFLKMSITNEQVQLGVQPSMLEFKDQFRSILAYFIRQLDEFGYCYITNIDSIKDIDTSMYEFMKNRGIKAQFGYALKDHSDNIIAFLCIEYIHRENIDIDKIVNTFKEHYKAVEALLNL